MRGALIGACLFEGWATDVEDAERILAAGEITLDPCHHHRTVGPMAGVTVPSMWMWCLEDPVNGGEAFCNLNEGLGKVLRMGAFNDEVLTRLAWMRDVLGPILSTAVRGRSTPATTARRRRRSSPRCCRWATRGTTATAPGR